MPNYFMERGERTKNLSNSHKRSKRQEKEIATKLGGRLTAASGSREVKGDVRIKGVLRIEAKTTKNKSFPVTREMIHKIDSAAVLTGEMGCLIVEFNDGFGKKLDEVAIISTYALQTLIDNQKS